VDHPLDHGTAALVEVAQVQATTKDGVRPDLDRMDITGTLASHLGTMSIALAGHTSMHSRHSVQRCTASTGRLGAVRRAEVGQVRMQTPHAVHDSLTDRRDAAVDLDLMSRPDIPGA
jgi:hypothetical protein